MIYKQIQHRAKLKHLNKEMQKYIKDNYKDIEDNDMVELLETRSFELYNTWKASD